MSASEAEVISLSAVPTSPQLIVFGRGPATEDHALAFADQCAAAGLACRLRPVDERQDLQLSRFPGLAVVLSELAAGVSVRAALGPCAALVTDYRARWPHGLSELTVGVDPLDVGVVQLVGYRVGMHHPTMRPAYRKACAVHLLDQGDPVDILGIYRDTTLFSVERDTPWDDPYDAAGEALERTWAYLRSWGVRDVQAVPVLLTGLERCRARYEKPSLSELYRPHRDWQRNRLDLILDGPDLPIQPAQLKTWNENGARVWREVLEALQGLNPGLHRPGRPNAPGAQKDLRRLYEGLKIVAAWLRTTPPDALAEIG